MARRTVTRVCQRMIENDLIPTLRGMAEHTVKFKMRSWPDCQVAIHASSGRPIETAIDVAFFAFQAAVLAGQRKKAVFCPTASGGELHCLRRQECIDII